MRSKRFSSFAGWAAVALVAAVGFAAFGGFQPSAEQSQTEAAAASLGHTAGAYAGLSFAMVGGQSSAALIDAGKPDPKAELTTETDSEDDAAQTSEGTIASPTSGWLSEVEIRALVSRYFEAADVNRAVRVAWCESRFDPNGKDLRTGGVGLFNHLPRYWEERSASSGFAGVPATDAEASTAAAAWVVYEGGGWDVFNCR